MAVFFVNGTEVTVEKNQRLLRYLRDTLHLTSVKDGCSEGACGACTVLIDGEPIRACTPFTDSLAGRHVITVEGLTDEEKRLYTYAYGEAGAVQCGFCIPGMVLCTKALLDRNLNPTDDQIRYALRNNYCRCTGYVKIMDAVRLAAKCRREGVIPEASENDWKLGSSVHRIDVEERCWATASIPTTGICPVCATALPSAASIRVPVFLPSTRRRRRRCPASCASLRRQISPAKTRSAI